MLSQPQNAPFEVVEIAGDIRPLLEQLGAPGCQINLAGAGLPRFQAVRSPAALRDFLHDHHVRVLGPLELPAIQRAFFHAARNELRELLALDHELAAEPLLQEFAAASREAGRDQLLRLRPLRGERLIKRYFAAVEDGRAAGSHTLVFGLTLAVYSVPLRQGLVGYACQTTRDLIQAAAPSLKLSQAETAALCRELALSVPIAVDTLLSPVAG